MRAIGVCGQGGSVFEGLGVDVRPPLQLPVMIENRIEMPRFLFRSRVIPRRGVNQRAAEPIFSGLEHRRGEVRAEV